MTTLRNPPSLYEPSQSEIDAVLKRDFFAFSRKAFRTVSPGVRFKPNWHHKVVAYHLNEVSAGRCRRLIINLPPRNLKSILASVAFPAFVLGQDPRRRIICASYSQDLANKHSRDCRAVMESKWYRSLHPEAALDRKRNTESHFMTVNRGERLATSVGGTLTGLGGDIIIIDDPLKPADAMSEKARQAVKEWFSSTIATRLDDKTTGAIVLVMQRLHSEDLAGHLLETGSWTLVNIPAIAVDDQEFTYGPGLVHHRRAGELLHPDHEPQFVLQEQKALLGTAAFEAQYQQNPVPPDGTLIKWSWFRTYGEIPSRSRNQQIYQSWDTAMTANELSDFSVCTTWCVDERDYFLLDVLRLKLDYPDLKRQILEHALRFNCRRVVIENKGSGQSLIQDIGRDGQLHPVPFNPEGDKIIRAAAQSALIEAGHVHIPERAPWLADFRLEILQFPHGKHDDQVDSLSQFLNYMDYQYDRQIFSRPF